tara:strand:+ start:135 stop:749 length:615 start_codon:yes stop_codon:yes gene_type:complete
MGADGGYQWLETTDPKALKTLCDWMFWHYQNTSCWAIDHAPQPEILETPEKGIWIEGGYGTSCEYDFEDFLYLIYNLTDSIDKYDEWEKETSYYFILRDYTFQELMDDLLTDPQYNIWAQGTSCGGPIVPGNYNRWWNDHAWKPILYSIVKQLRNVVPRADGYTGNPWPEIYIPKNLLNITIGEWATQVNALLPGGIHFQETWT